jgi:hypothetical protein
MSKKVRKVPSIRNKPRGKVSTNTGNLWELLDRVLASKSDSQEMKKNRQLKSSLSGTSGKRLQRRGVKYIDLE